MLLINNDENLEQLNNEFEKKMLKYVDYYQLNQSYMFAMLMKIVLQKEMVTQRNL